MTTIKRKPAPKKKKPTAKKPQALPKYAIFDEIIYSDTDLTDLEEPICLEQGVIHSIEFRNKTFYYGLKGSTGYASTSVRIPYGDCYETYSSGQQELEEKEILGTLKNSDEAINKIFDARIKELEIENWVS